MLENLHRTKAMGFESKKLLESGDLMSYAQLMHEHWLNKRSRSADMANSHIDALYATALQNGAVGGKLIGAGGGGFLLVYSEVPERTRSAMAGAGAVELPFDFEYTGATAEGLI
jgi:D-glycero-alpha-D-manno-heptose-7-phosphate kinase